MVSKLIHVFALALALSFGVCAYAQTNSPVGLWRTIDDKTGKERSLIRIVENNGVYEGEVEKIFDQPGDDPQHLCRKCEGERKDKPIVGMTILWGLKKDGDQYTGGEILDATGRQDLPLQDESRRGRKQARSARVHRRVAVRALADLGARGVERLNLSTQETPRTQRSQRKRSDAIDALLSE